MNRGVLYFVAGDRHNVHAIVSIASLRKWWKGPVAICTEDQGPGRECAEWIARDDALAPVQVIPDKQMIGGGKGKSYFAKTVLPRLSPFEQTIFLDADTLVVGDISPLWPDVASGEFVLTQFADWVTTGSKMRGRLTPWGDVDPERTGRMLQDYEHQTCKSQVYHDGRWKWPALNTGVMAWSVNSEQFTEDWHHTCAKRVVFMADELAAQIIFPDHPHRIMDDRFNASVVYPRQGQAVEDRPDARILHGHGGKFWKRESGRTLWLPAYLECLRLNRANIVATPPQPKWFRSLTAGQQQQVAQHLSAEALPAAA